ncbi:MAG TPA: cytochrome C oxidase subunit IV family protein [Candidatus Omnitrophota bacterium]|nr:hypothetical protein [Candidatus Omnitrophota bacterium]HRK61027.1 cytochrome C oxidase subunit IV family protein [Candidatus Omnitrophota bacterium]
MSAHSHDSQHHGGIGIYVIILTALLVLTAVTVWAAFIDFGRFNTVIALAIAFFKATLVMLFFMHLKGSSGLLKLFVLSAFAFLAVLIGMTLNDYATRHWGSQLEKDSWITRSPHHYADAPASSANAAQHH